MKKPAVVAVVPARLGSRRFPGKVIYPYRGRPLISYLLQDLAGARKIDRVIVATDSGKVRRLVEGLGVEVKLTSSKHATGTDRVAEAIKGVRADLILNVQADNFGLKGRVLDNLIDKIIADRSIDCATVACRIVSDSELFDPNIVKVIKRGDGNALVFSRFPLPYLSGAGRSGRAKQFRFLGHIGVYFFRPGALKRFAGHRRTPLEKAESLEQLRILEYGDDIRLFETSMRSVSVDTKADLRKLDQIYK